MESLLKKYKYHLYAIFTVIVWGATFISSKLLIVGGVTPATLLIYRFSIAYVGIWFISEKKLMADSLKDEFKLMLAGFFGGTLYFVTENSALGITQVSNVAIILATTPLLTAIVARIAGERDRLNRRFVIGSFIALFGVSLAVFNGSVILDLNPAGDALSFCSALSWSIYMYILKGLSGRYSTVFITRKVFFYGVATLLPLYPVLNMEFSLVPFQDMSLVAHLLFLSVVASLVCFIMWNRLVKEISPVSAASYLYFPPVVSLVAAFIILDETITFMAICGIALILFGVYISSKRGGNAK
ncbi:MAG: DMT family transporter [Rikenellaceae bacterium]